MEVSSPSPSLAQLQYAPEVYATGEVVVEAVEVVVEAVEAAEASSRARQASKCLSRPRGRRGQCPPASSGWLER